MNIVSITTQLKHERRTPPSMRWKVFINPQEKRTVRRRAKRNIITGRAPPSLGDDEKALGADQAQGQHTPDCDQRRKGGVIENWTAAVLPGRLATALFRAQQRKVPEP